MAQTEAISPAAFSETRERWLIWLLCVLAAIRVLIFSAAFPFFSNIDEQQHFDLVIKYANWKLPHGLERYSDESSRYLATFNSPEYLLMPNQFPDGKYPPPPWKQPFDEIRPQLLAQVVAWESRTNHEVSQPPLYYATAGLWMRLGETTGLHDGYLLYWIRFLNAPIVGLLVWLGFVAAKTIFPDKFFLRLATPTLLAFFPQDALYSIQNDAFSPVCFGAAFVCVLLWLRAERPAISLAVATGLSLSASFLVKTSNLPLVGIAWVVLLLDLGRRTRQANGTKILPVTGILFLAFAVPTALLLIWNKHTFGDFTGSAARIQALGWTHKPFRNWWSHPIFTPHGFWIFSSDILASFWRGEFVWQRHQLASPAADIFYRISSLFFVVAAIVGLILRASYSTESRRALWFSLACCVAAVAFLGLASISFDFGNCFYPSREHPFITSGRLLTGMMIPFALLYAFGLEVVFSRIKSGCSKALTLLGIVVFTTASEVVVNLPAFSSQYNWFHL